MTRMHPRTVALAVALSLAVGWALGGRFSGQASGTGTSLPSRGPTPLGVESPRGTTPLTEQLRLKLDRERAMPRPSRNPFVFGSRPAAPSAVAGRESTIAPDGTETPLDVPVQPASPRPYTLAGIASVRAAEGMEYTAVLSGAGGVVFARPGDALPGDLVVVEVQETMVTIRDRSGVERTLRLP